MTPKEKAKELVDRFTPSTRQYNSEFGWEDSLYYAKEAALIAIDETLWVLNELDHDLPDDDAILFYSEVKQEIEKL